MQAPLNSPASYPILYISLFHHEIIMIFFLLSISFSSFFSSNFMSHLPLLLLPPNKLIPPQSSYLMHQSQSLSMRM